MVQGVAPPNWVVVPESPGDHEAQDAREGLVMEGHIGGGMHVFWLPFMFFFWVVVVPRIVGAIRHGRGRRRATPDGAPSVEGDRALSTLRERFARGEIDRREYEERREALLSNLPDGAAS